MQDVDRYVDRLYEPCINQLGVSLIKTQWHRYAADLNRIPEDVDASSVNGSVNPSGLFPRGFHWVMTTKRETLMPTPMALETHQSLVKLIYDPFHTSLRNIYANFKSQGAKSVFHLDVHSMPSVGTSEHRDPGQGRAEIVVSDCKGKSARPEFVDLVIAAYAKAGFRVAYNWPYFGGRVSEQYGNPLQGCHAVQVELNRSLYMDESSKKIIPADAEKVAQKLQKAVAYILNNLVVE